MRLCCAQHNHSVAISTYSAARAASLSRSSGTTGWACRSTPSGWSVGASSGHKRRMAPPRRSFPTCLKEFAHHLRGVLLRQKSICDNQCHHARENQQSREGFSDHWPRRMARSRWIGLRFRRSLGLHDFALCRWRASLWFRRRAHASHLIVVSAVDLANGKGRGLGLAHRLESGSIASQKGLCV